MPKKTLCTMVELVKTRTPPRNLVGCRFGQLEVIEYAGWKRVHYWRCRCDCGKDTVVTDTNLRHSTRSCGHVKHGYTRRGFKSKEYNAWKNMKRRCIGRTPEEIANYRGRGIRVCDRWAHSFETFLLDMGPCPDSPNMSLERIDGNRGYEPGNCKWATRMEQTLNRRVTHMITRNGKTQCAKAWCNELGVDYTTAVRYAKQGKASLEVLIFGA